MKKELVSIVIPVFNGADYVCEAVKSALSQTYKPIEIIVVNDGSDDDGKTKACLQPFMDKIIYLEKKNGGVATALNMGIRAMSGDFFTWLSHDDLFDERKVELQIETIQRSGNKMDICAMNYCFFDVNEKTRIETNFQNYYQKELLESSIFLLLWGELHFSSLLFSREHFNRVGLFNESLRTAQDNDFIFRLLRNQKIIFLNDIGSYVRVHERSGTSQLRDIVNKENANLYKVILDSLSEEELKDISGNAQHTINKLLSIITSMSSEEKYVQDTNKAQQCNYVLIGAGGYGRRLNYELIAAGLKPKMFLDNDQNKDGIFIDGTLCKKFDLGNISKNDKLIITNKYYLPLEKQLLSMGITNYVKKDDIESMLFDFYQ